MLPLAFCIVPEAAERGRVAAFVKSRGMACSVYGAQYLLEALFEAGLEEDALELMTRDEPRGWLNMVKSGSTVTLEAWDIRYKPNLDWNHAWGAVPVNILPRYVMGVRPLEPGFGKILIRPQVGALEGIQGTVPTIRGPVTVGVRRRGRDEYALSLEIPFNTVARAELPVPPEAGYELSLDDKPIQAAMENGRLVVDGVASGKHRVMWRLKEGACASSDASGNRGIFGRGWLSGFPWF
jgi:hypothetical protein